MSRKVIKSKFRNLGRFMLFLAVFLLAFAAPVFGQIKSVRSRVLKEPSDIVATQKANFQVGDLITSPLVSITIDNGDGEAVLLLKMRIDLGGEWDEDWVIVSFVKKMSPNTSFTFRNSDLISGGGGQQVDKSGLLSILRNDIEYSSTLLVNTKLSNLDDAINQILSGEFGVKEGEYKIELSVYEITNAIENKDDKDSKIDISKVPPALKTESVSFMVVNVNEISEIKLPTYDNLMLSFRVPEIPT